VRAMPSSATDGTRACVRGAARAASSSAASR
jgi:hypothetical protein